MNATKYWRFNGSEFIPKSVDYLYEEVTKFYDDEIIDTMFKDDDKKSRVKKLCRDAIEQYNKDKYTMDTVNALAAALESNCNDWADFSQNPYSKLDDIALRLAISNETGHNIVCVCFVCDNNMNLTEDFIEDLMYLSSNVSNYRQFNDYHVNAVVNVLDKGSMYDKYKATESKAFTKLYGKRISKVTTKVSFKYMTLSKLSKEFLDKHKILIDRDTARVVEVPQNYEDYSI